MSVIKIQVSLDNEVASIGERRENYGRTKRIRD